MTVTVGQGRNVAAVANHVGVFPERHCRFICGIGGTKRDNQLIDADHISRNLARKFNGFSETLYAPAYVETPELRAAFMQNRLIKATLEQASKADVAIIGLGDMNENSFMVQLGWFTPQEIATARQEQGVVGDLAGYSFFNIQGKPVDTVMNDRVIGLSLEQLRAIPASSLSPPKVRKRRRSWGHYAPGLSMCWLPAPRTPVRSLICKRRYK